MIKDLLIRSPASPVATFIFAHGAGAPMDSDFMNEMTALLVERGVRVVRFEFPYMQERRENGKRRPPNKQEELLASFREVVTSIGFSCTQSGPIFIGGKSMGGRMASLLVDELSGPGSVVKGLVCLGYPFHPQGKPDKLRTSHLEPLRSPSLIVQGTRDALGSREEVETYALSDAIQLHWLEDGDHNLKPRVKSGFTHVQHMATTADAIRHFMDTTL